MTPAKVKAEVAMTKPSAITLLADIERKDQHFRNAMAVFLTIMILALFSLLAFSYHLNQQNRQLLKAQADVLASQSQLIKNHSDEIETIQKNTQTSVNELGGQIDCLVTLFTKPNRANLTITDVHSCDIQPSSSPAANKPVTFRPSQPATTSPSSSPTPAPASNTGDKPAPTPEPKPTPAPSLLCTVSLKLIGC